MEYEDGTVEREWPNAIQFADSRGLFDSMAWEPPTETNKMCDTCAHENPVLWAQHCGENKYDCTSCKEPDCICKTCTDSDKWEPKEGQA